MPALRRTLSILALALWAVPAFAQATATVKYECQDPTGFEVLAWITLSGTHYSLKSQMQVSGEGELALQDGGSGLVVLSGPLARDFGLLGAKPASGPKLTFVDERGPVMICRQQQS
ncbi:hypothetical protein ABIB57_001723 [Devosia sp. UYZn731]|uniref:hypothetical protein n=1 Tax=Devosia sp. UYZn731 TaxID=3156345 RepID=UPI00339946C1